MVDQDPVGKPRSLVANTLSGIGYLSSSTMATAILRLIVVGVMARLLAPDDFGVVAVAGIFVEFSRIVTTTGIAQSLIQRPTLTANEIRTAFTVSMAVGVLAMVAVVASAGLIADFFELPKLRPVLYVSSIIPPIVAMSTISSKLLERLHNFKPIAQSNITSYIVAQVVFGVPIALLGGGVWALVIPQIAAALLQSAMLFRAQPHLISFYFGRAEYRSLMELGTGFGLQRFANFLAQRGDYFVVGSMLGPDALGKYERSYVLMNLSNSLLSSMLNTVLFPAFSRIADDKDRFRRAYAQCQELTATITIPASALCVVLAREIVETLLGSNWLDATLPFAILAAGIFFRTSYKVANTAGNGLGLAYRNAVSQTIYAVLVIGGAVLAYPWGISGVAVSTLVAITVMFVILNHTVVRQIGLPWTAVLKTMLPGLMSAILLSAVAFTVVLVVGEETSWPAFVRLCLALASAGFVYAVALLCAPKVFLGKETIKLLHERGPSAGPARAVLRLLNR